MMIQTYFKTFVWVFTFASVSLEGLNMTPVDGSPLRAYPSVMDACTKCRNTHQAQSSKRERAPPTSCHTA